ncbi:DUF4097 family beta strand repeat-containing protein, partial [Acinetobacter sp. AGC35]
GNVSAAGNGDEVDIYSKNGNLEVNGAPGKLHAESLNGGIEVRSPLIRGDWDVYSAVGDIFLYLPFAGDYTVNGSSGYGNITTDFHHFNIDKKTISGETGTGEFKLRIEGNSNLNVMRY